MPASSGSSTDSAVTSMLRAPIQLAAQAAGAHTFNEAALRQTLGAIAQCSRATDEDIDRALDALPDDQKRQFLGRINR